MKHLYLFIIIAASQGSVVKDLPPASINKITTFDPPGFKVSWTKIDNPEVLGYKLRVWELQGDVVYHYEVVDGKKKLVPSHNPPVIKSDVIPKEIPMEIIVHGADSTEARYNDAKLGVQYEIRVLGYTSEGDGPMSSPSGIRLEENKGFKNKDYQ